MNNFPAMTEEQRQAFIEDCEEDIYYIKCGLVKHPNNSALLSRLQRQQIALAALTADPVAVTEKHEISNMHATGLYLRAWPLDRRLNEQEGYTIKLYPSPLAPVLRFPDELTVNDAPSFMEPDERTCWVLGRTSYEAELKRLNASAPAVPDGWIKCSERMPEEGGRYWCYVEEQNCLGKSHYQWNCAWNGEVWSDDALTGRVTHWMPLPAPPEASNEQ